MIKIFIWFKKNEPYSKQNTDMMRYLCKKIKG